LRASEVPKEFSVSFKSLLRVPGILGEISEVPRKTSGVSEETLEVLEETANIIL
jgi:hypothetical protein